MKLFLLSCLVATALLPNLHANEGAPGRVVLEWAGQPPGIISRPPHNEIVMLPRRGGKPLIVDGQSAQPSPFPNAIPALTVQTEGADGTGEENVSLVLNPFRGINPPAKGWVEFDVAVENHLMVVTFTVDAASDNPTEKVPDVSGRGGHLLCSLFLRGGGKPIIVLSQNAETQKATRTHLSGKLPPGAPQTFRIAWDWEAEQPGLRFFLNGEPLLLKETEEVFPVDREKVGKGLNSLGVSLTGKGTFLGRIRTSE